ncbi:efflux transporter outer membrane subunit [Hymenobacter aerilatus]|uniref:Efflux transporter outer membrane subunit n=1 Tax=Hymenobacter aerilatus TaxID=2932251 RepID=A0A8T9T2Z6_9BACT|nr:efflux transporter outer membrane subunit [Hymenobacter aerilatus]UOR06349.1 efflux transporter outer membrane subunit [Hymenobacter aerilatus]
MSFSLRYYSLSILMLSALLVGCVRAPQYQPPSVTAPTTWKNSTDTTFAAPQNNPPPATAAAAAELPQQPAVPAWWSIFQDDELARLEQQVLAANYSLKAAVVRVEQARANVTLVNSYRSPVVALNPQAFRQRLSAYRPLPIVSPNGPQAITQTQFYLPLNVSYEVDVWGRLRRNVQAAEADRQAAEEDLRTVQLSLTADAASYYFDLRGLDAELLVLDSARQARVESLQLTQARNQAGVDNEIAVRRAETELANVDAGIVEVRRQRAGLEAALATLAGQPASQFALLARPGQLSIPRVPAAVPASLLARRPDLRRTERQLAALNARADAARLARLPTVQLSGLVGPLASGLGDLPKVTDSYTYYAGGGVSIPIFNGGRLRATQQIAERQYDEQAAQYRQTALVAFQEVETSLANVQQSAAQLVVQQRALRSARLAGLLTKERYRAGLTSYFEVVDADRQTLDAARLVVQNQANELSFTVQLIRALGGGWE